MSRDSEPRLTTDPALLDVLQQVVAWEPIFHRPEFGTRRSDFERMVTPEFWEVGASGRRYSRDYVLDELEKRHGARPLSNGGMPMISTVSNSLRICIC